MDHLHAAVFEILHNLFVVNNRPEGVDRLFTALNFTVYRIDRPFDTEAEACTFLLFSLQRLHALAGKA